MTLPLADRGIDACVAALQRAGFELREHGERRERVGVSAPRQYVRQ